MTLSTRARRRQRLLLLAGVLALPACGRPPNPSRVAPAASSASGGGEVPSAANGGAETSWVASDDAAEPEAAQGSEEAPDGALACPTLFAEELRQRWFVIGGQEYWFDEEGRPARARAWLPPVAADDERDAGCQRQVGQWGDATGADDYDGGHLIGYQLGGWGARANLVPQQANFNRGNWAQVESAIASCDELGDRQLELLVEVEYGSDDELVPAAMVMTMTDTATGQSIALPFANERGGGSDGEALRREGVAWLRTLGCAVD